MNTDEILTPAFRHWAEAAGFGITPHTDDGRILVWADGGEQRWFISEAADGWWIIESSDRMMPEQFDWAAAEPGLVERRFVATFLTKVRSRRGLAAIRIPGSADQLPSGMSLGSVRFRGTDRRALIDLGGTTLAVSAGGQLLSAVRLVQLAILAEHGVDATVASFLNTEGAPIFSLR